ncbi:SLC13 family permease [Flexivirga caeni]|uniref:SLC13 family permease n=1 Tax=Flexivirga caeni TaxID=2294115 RepID=A0A3M9MFH3_9MICO|nr:SLC13 family permease [Flexivirga caeni]RNI23897.1 SLC13 family permease [Flexivirga caeni]
MGLLRRTEGGVVHSLLIAIAIIASIGISYRTKINTGLLAIVFAYLIGVFVLGMKPAAVTALWPVPIFFTILAVTLFFSVAIENGTLEKISQRMLYRSRGLGWGLAVVFFVTAIVMAGLGAGFYAVMVFLAPAALVICAQVKIEPLLAGLGVIVGAQVGSNLMTSLNGIIYRGLFEKLGYSQSRSFGISFAIFIAYLVLTALVVVGLTLYYRRKAISRGEETRRGQMEVTEPEPFDFKQRVTIVLIGVFLLLALVPSILHVLFGKVDLFGTWASNIDPPLLSVVLAVVAMLLGAADSHRVIARVPWNILIMISGMGMLIQVAVAAGTIRQIANWLGGGHVPTYLVPVVLALVAAVITAFSSYIGVTAPALFPIVPTLAAVTHLNPTLLFVCATIGGLSMAISPYSEGGAMVMGFSPEGQQDAMYRKELTVGLPVMGGSALVASLILTLVFH